MFQASVLQDRFFLSGWPLAKTHEDMIPSIAERESAWLRMQERLTQAPRKRSFPTVTISRQFGCEGYLLAERLQHLLEEASGQPWHLFDKALVEKVASDQGLSRQLLSHLGDESHAQDLLRGHFGFTTQNDTYAALVKAIVQIATGGRAIIVGRGAAIVCNELQNCFHFRLEGSLAFRTSTLANQRGLPLADAERLVRTQSKLRENFIMECLQADIAAPQWYDARFNNERLGVDAIAEACLSLIASRWPDKGFFRHQEEPLEARK